MWSEFTLTNFYISAFLLILIVILWTYRYYQIYFQYWKKRGVHYATPFPIFGNLLKVSLLGKNYIHIVNAFYKKFSGLRYFGMYRYLSPCLVIRDPAIVKDIIVNHSDCFQDRGIGDHSNNNLIFRTMYYLEGKPWKLLRKELCFFLKKESNSQVFAMSKTCAEKMSEILKNPERQSNCFDAREISFRFATDISGLYLLGLELNVVENFTNNIRNLWTTSWKENFLQNYSIFFPKLRKIFKLFEENKAQEILVDFTKAILQYRKGNLVIRNDLVQLFLRLKNSSDRSQSKRFGVEDQEKIEVSNTLITAHLMEFIVGGSEVISLYMSFCLHELSLNQDIQDNLRHELNTMLLKNNGQFTEGSILKSNYLDKVVNETIRKYHILHIERICTKSYGLPGSSVMLERGDRVIMPIHSFYHDPKYYPNPEVFDPERFSRKNKFSRPSYTFIPFGKGPRNCICADYCIIQLKVGIAMLILNFNVKLCSKSIIPLPVEHVIFINVPSKGVWLEFENVR